MGAQDWRRRLIIGITGASGTIYGVRLLQVCRELGLEVHLCMSKAAELTLSYELDMRAAEVRALAHKSYAPSDVGAAIASGSFRTRGMIIAPCSIRTMAEIATGTTSSALTRAADVVLKERRPLVLMVRETPLHAGHLENLLKLARLGAVIAPAGAGVLHQAEIGRGSGRPRRRPRARPVRPRNRPAPPLARGGELSADAACEETEGQNEDGERPSASEKLVRSIWAQLSCSARSGTPSRAHAGRSRALPTPDAQPSNPIRGRRSTRRLTPLRAGPSHTLVKGALHHRRGAAADAGPAWFLIAHALTAVADLIRSLIRDRVCRTCWSRLRLTEPWQRRRRSYCAAIKRRTCRNHLAGAQGLAKSRASCAMPKTLESNRWGTLVGSSPPSRW